MQTGTNKNFQYLVLGIFIFFAVAGVAVFSLAGKFGGNKSEGPAVELTVWGMENKKNFDALLSKIDERSPGLLKVTYVQKRYDTFNQDLLEALAAGKGPDILLLPHDKLVENLDRIYEIPYDSYRERSFKDHFIEQGEMFLSEKGIYAVPFSLDPLVMFWNRQMFTDAGLVLPPVYWDQLSSETLPLTHMDSSRNIRQSAIALGDFSNVLHAKEILSTLILQSGNKIVAKNDKGEFVSILDQGSEGSSPAVSALRFFTEFSNPSKQIYSWNKSLSNSKTAFISNDLAMYLGFASESAEIVSKNPNLNFDVAVVPQIREASRVGFGRLSGFAIMNRTPHKADAFSAISILTSEQSISDWAAISVLPPVRRSLLAKRPKEAYPAVFYDSAVISRGWLDPNREKSSEVFKKMVENVTSGRLKLSEAVDRASDELDILMK